MLAPNPSQHLDGVDGPRPDGIAMCQGGAVNRTTPRAGAVPMQIITIGLDIAKNVFQVHGIDGEGRAVLRRKGSPRSTVEVIQ
jgi:hypothetical protein